MSGPAFNGDQAVSTKNCLKGVDPVPREGAGSRMVLSSRGTRRSRTNSLGIVMEMDQKL